jgi:hypothetical protein
LLRNNIKASVSLQYPSFCGLAKKHDAKFSGNDIELSMVASSLVPPLGFFRQAPFLQPEQKLLSRKMCKSFSSLSRLIWFVPAIRFQSPTLFLGRADAFRRAIGGVIILQALQRW